MPTTITQTWGTSSGTTTHTWATFTYSDLEINTNFSGISGVNIYGPWNGAIIKVLSRVTYADGSNMRFDYNSYGQVYQFNSWAADNHQLNYIKYDLPTTTTTAQSDCPRFTQSSVNAQYWNLNSSQQPQDVTTSYSIADNQSKTIDGTTWNNNLRVITITSADGTIDKIYSHSTFWDEGMPRLVETYSSDNTTTPKRSVITHYNQDDMNLSYILNPRVVDTKITDGTNTKHTTIAYWMNDSPNESVSVYGLVKYVLEYDQTETSQYRKTYMTYNMNSAYVNRRIIGLVGAKEVYDASNNLIAKTSYAYDEGDFEDDDIQQDVQPIRHDYTNYGASFITGRGLLTSITRWNAPNLANSITSTIKYNTAGLPVSTKDPLNHEVKTNYTDSFDNVTGTNTYAYPTSITDPANNTSYSKYNFYTGAIKRLETPAPHNHTQGAIKTWSYDSVGRIERVTLLNNGSYTRHVYPTTGNVIETYTTVTDYNNNQIADTADEVKSEVYTDGLGRTIKSRSDLPNAPEGQYAASKVEYDQLGRVMRQSNMAEVNSSWQVVGDDATNGWLWTSYNYDWKGRVILTTNTDNTVTQANYEGCGCAGGEIITITDAGTVIDGVTQLRRKKVYTDILGRPYKNQILNWDLSVYSTAMTKYNERDQVTSVRQYQGQEPSNWADSCPTGTCLETYSTYDGHGRLESTKKPSQTAPDVFTYFDDDTVATKTDARGVVTEYLYNSRKLVTDITYTVPQGSSISETLPTHYNYDNVGNVTSMTDASGSLSFQYDQLSRITSETKTFPGLSNSYTLNYAYTFTGQLQSVNIPSNTSFNYSYDKIGRLSQVGSAGYVGAVGNEVTSIISSLKYRSWGAVKEMNYSNGMTTTLAYNTKQLPTSYQVTNFYNDSQAVVGSTYEYYNDGMLRKVTNLDDDKFDRAYTYDHVGRVKEALTGNEARGGTTADGPYKQTYSYDVWGNNVNFSHRRWTLGTITETPTFTNNRRQGYTYDAAGQVTISSDGSHGYDAASRPTTFVSNVYVNSNGNYLPALESTTTYSSRGVPEKQETTTRTDGTILVDTTARYFLHSSVLGGQTVAEINHQGVIRTNYIYASGMKIATCSLYTYPTNYWDVVWQHTDPMTGSNFGTGYTGGYYISGIGLVRHLDPFGVDVTEPPNLLVLEEPTYLNPHKNFFWPLEYAWHDITLVGETMSQRDLAMAEWGQRLQNTMDTIAARNAAQRGDLATAQQIMEQNPNVGIQASGPGGSVTLWGKDAAGFLVGLSTLGYVLAQDSNTLTLSGENPQTGQQQQSGQNSTPSQQQKPIWCDKKVIEAMNKAWSLTGNANQQNKPSPKEAGFNLNGTPSNFKVSSSFTNQVGKMTIKYNTLAHSDPTFANFHVHPLGHDGTGMPSTPDNNFEGNGKGDTGAADDIYNKNQGGKHQAIQIYVMSWKGLSMYDPSTKQSVQLVKGTGFLKGNGCPK